MLFASIWYLDLWSKSSVGGGFARSMTKPGASGEYEMMPAALVWTLATAGVPAIHIAGTPYHQISKASAYLDDYVHVTDPKGKMSHFSFTKRRFVYSNQWLRRSAARVGARLVPGLGWGLLAYDLYTVGRWYMQDEVDPLGLK